MKPLAIAAAAAAVTVGSALAFGQEPAPAPATTTTKAVAPAPAPAPAQGTSELKDVKSRFSYIVGYNIGSQFKAGGADIDLDVFLRAIKDAQAGTKSIVSEAEAQETAKVLQQQQMEQAAKAGESKKREGEAFLAANLKKPGVQATASGLQYKVIKQGTGSSPKPTDVATVHYEGRFLDGKVFDSSYKKGEPAQFQPAQVILGWKEALQLMKAGSEWELYVPSDLAYGPRGNQGIPPNSTLIFKVELIAVNGQK